MHPLCCTPIHHRFHQWLVSSSPSSDFIRDNYVISLIASHQFMKAVNMGVTRYLPRGGRQDNRLRVLFEIRRRKSKHLHIQ
ncbi:hypothetical protein BDFB_005525 [Asbolus verrucosus]|uniref:Uncharacterized protein n=1 Tax=Asbolus verrucosus TaxID=1661398 RepID=A0A482W2L3_ASBVE|nr:hypothetical protein BDFB_005525 [Asbolus verrucosus]